MEYEKFSQEVYELILKKEGFENIPVLHNIKKQGLSKAIHQVDVYFEYSLGGTNHAVAIECKDYTSAIEQGKIFAFKSKIDDIPEVTKGIFISKSGFQSGAITFAKAHGIELVELRKAEDDDWEGLIKIIEGELIAYSIKNVTISNCKVNKEWAEKNNLKTPIEIKFLGLTNEIYFYDGNNKIKHSLYDLINKLPAMNLEEKEYEHKFEFEDTYFEDEKQKKYKIDNITLKYSVEIYKSKMKIDDACNVKAIKTSIVTGEKEFIRK
ncbi:MAG: restriction endonuclease [Fusobacteriaceae bacterium]